MSFLFLTNCNHEYRHPIEGNWIGYHEGLIFGKDTVGANFHAILSIDKDSIIARNFKYITDGNRDSISSRSYKLVDSILITNQNTKSPDSVKIEFLSNNRLNISTTESVSLYTRLLKHKNEIQTFNLVGNTFTISDSIQVIDTIEFLDNSSFLIYNLYIGGISHIQEWRIKQFLGYSLLIIDDPELPVFFIRRTQNNNYELSVKPDSQIKWYLKELERNNKIEKTILLGKWTGKSNIPDSNIEFEFDLDSVRMNDITGGEIIKQEYILNLNNDLVFIYNSKNYRIMRYRINDIKHDSLFLSRISPFKDSFILTRMN